MKNIIKSALVAGAIALAPLGKIQAQSQTTSKQVATTLSQNPYQTTIDSVAKANASFSKEDIKIISQYADHIDKFQIEQAEQLYAANPIIKSYLKLFPGGGKLRKDYLAIKNGDEEIKKKLDESKKLDKKLTVKSKEDQQLDQTVAVLDQRIEKNVNSILIDIEKIISKKPISIENKKFIQEQINELRKNTHGKFEKEFQKIELQLK